MSGSPGPGRRRASFRSSRPSQLHSLRPIQKAYPERLLVRTTLGRAVGKGKAPYRKRGTKKSLGCLLQVEALNLSKNGSLRQAERSWGTDGRRAWMWGWGAGCGLVRLLACRQGRADWMSPACWWSHELRDQKGRMVFFRQLGGVAQSVRKQPRLHLPQREYQTCLFKKSVNPAG